MKKNIDDRVLLEAYLFLDNNGTVRSIAKILNVSKSTIHYDLAYRLKKINYSLYKEVDKLLKFNLAERHIRGGQATKNKYKKSQQISAKMLQK